MGLGVVPPGLLGKSAGYLPTLMVLWCRKRGLFQPKEGRFLKQLTFAIQRIHVVVDGDVADTFTGKIDFRILARHDDPETKWIVEKIFDMAVHGMGAAKIMKALIREKVPTPGYLHYIKEGAPC